MQILIVEDDVAAGDALRQLLEMDGHTVALARSLTEARAAAANQRFDVALVDLALPDGSGRDLVPELKTTTERVYLATGSSLLVSTDAGVGFEPVNDTAAACGADAALGKPIDYDALLRMLD